MAAISASVYLSVTPAMPETPDNTLLNSKDIIYCLAGVFLGGLITHIYYLIGKKSDERSEKRVALAKCLSFLEGFSLRRSGFLQALVNWERKSRMSATRSGEFLCCVSFF
jgi:hypothetical protein